MRDIIFLIRGENPNQLVFPKFHMWKSPVDALILQLFQGIFYIWPWLIVNAMNICIIIKLEKIFLLIIEFRIFII